MANSFNKHVWSEFKNYYGPEGYLGGPDRPNICSSRAYIFWDYKNRENKLKV